MSKYAALPKSILLRISRQIGAETPAGGVTVPSIEKADTMIFKALNGSLRAFAHLFYIRRFAIHQTLSEDDLKVMNMIDAHMSDMKRIIADKYDSIIEPYNKREYCAENYEFTLNDHQEIFTIKNFYTQLVMFEVEAESLKDAVEQLARQRADLRDANLEGAKLIGANLEGANLIGAYLKIADLRGANLRRANFRGAYLEEANLEGADLKEANLREADLERANLEVANLESANLEDADLEDANLERANLREAYLARAELIRSNLRGIDLKDADLEDANLEGSNLEGADLRRANLEGANLEGADLRRAKLEGANLERAIGLHLNENYEFTLNDPEPEEDTHKMQTTYCDQCGAEVPITAEGCGKCDGMFCRNCIDNHDCGGEGTCNICGLKIDRFDRYTYCGNCGRGFCSQACVVAHQENAHRNIHPDEYRIIHPYDRANRRLPFRESKQLISEVRISQIYDIVKKVATKLIGTNKDVRQMDRETLLDIIAATVEFVFNDKLNENYEFILNDPTQTFKVSLNIDDVIMCRLSTGIWQKDKVLSVIEIFNLRSNQLRWERVAKDFESYINVRYNIKNRTYEAYFDDYSDAENFKNLICTRINIPHNLMITKKSAYKKNKKDLNEAAYWAVPGNVSKAEHLYEIYLSIKDDPMPVNKDDMEWLFQECIGDDMFWRDVRRQADEPSILYPLGIISGRELAKFIELWAIRFLGHLKYFKVARQSYNDPIVRKYGVPTVDLGIGNILNPKEEKPELTPENRKKISKHLRKPKVVGKRAVIEPEAIEFVEKIANMSFKAQWN